MANKPTLISYTETAWNSTGLSKSTASISWNAGDVLVMIGGADSGITIGIPTATGLTFTSFALVTTSSGARGASALATSAGSGTVSASNSSSTSNWGFGVWVWRGSAGLGSTASPAPSATKIIGVTPFQGGTHSGYCYATFDFSGAAVGAAVGTPTPTNIRQAAQFLTAYTGWVDDLIDQPSSGSVNYGISGGTSTGPFTIIVAEVLGLASLPNNYQSIKVGDGMSVGERIR